MMHFKEAYQNIAADDDVQRYPANTIRYLIRQKQKWTEELSLSLSLSLFLSLSLTLKGAVGLLS